MADDRGKKRPIPWWRTPGALLLWALIVGLLITIAGRFLQ